MARPITNYSFSSRLKRNFIGDFIFERIIQGARLKNFVCSKKTLSEISKNYQDSVLVEKNLFLRQEQVVRLYI